MNHLPIVATLILAAVGGVVAIGGRAMARDVDADAAAAALERNEIMAVSEILTKVKERHDGRILDIRLEDGGRGLHGWIYKIRLLKPDGRILLLKMDAATSSVLAVGGEGEEQKPR